MNKILITLIVSLFATSVVALTVIPAAVKTSNDVAVSKPAAKSHTGTWLPPKEIQDKVAKEKQK